MKNILLLIHDDAGQEARLGAALALVRALDGRLICLDIACQRVVVGDGFGADGGVLLLEEECATEAANRRRLERRLSDAAVAWEWFDVAGFPEPCIEDVAADADLIVVNCGPDRCAGTTVPAIACDLLIRAGKPVLAVPDRGRGLAVSGDALVAWDGSRPVRAALSAALPLLRLARSVTLFSAGGGIPSQAEAAAALSNAGIAARLLGETGSGAAEAILAQAASGEYDYLVMGGFSHFRVTEALFGGVTRTLLRESPIALFLAH